MADTFLEVEQIVSMTLMATLKLDLPADERKAAVSLAKAKVARSAKFVGQNAIQTHGGIGITQELAIGHYFKRATMIEGQFGSADYHLDRCVGLDVIAAVRSATGRHVPAIVITADQSPEVQRDIRLQDAGLLRKPLKAAALRAMLARYTLRRMAAE